MRPKRVLLEENMPSLIPIPMQQDGSGYFKRLKSWLFANRKFKLNKDWYFRISSTERIFIPKDSDFIFDGASIPRYLWWLLSPTGILLIPGLIHDFAYKYSYLIIVNDNGESYKKPMTQKLADELFKQVSEDINGLKVISGVAWSALKFFGVFAWNKHKKAGTHGKEIEY